MAPFGLGVWVQGWGYGGLGVAIFGGFRVCLGSYEMRSGCARREETSLVKQGIRP